LRVKTWLRQIEKRMQDVAKVRDKIDSDISTMETLRSECEDAWQLLQEARDKLSELV
jgi:hypothetical protein